MVHRGPDDDGIYVDPQADVGLGARRLSIVDLDGGHQPLANEDGSVWAVLNGEIYNHASLRARLEDRGHRFASRTDTEVLVHLYEEYGADLVHALEGMFAFAVWDRRCGLLVVGRDRFGEKPLFYAERAGTLAFASELTALTAGIGTDGELDPESVDAYFRFGYVPGPATLLRDVVQLPPGHVLVWEHRSRATTVRPYWTPAAMPVANPTPFVELVAETRWLLEQSVRSRLVADVPVGVFLSGGVDSTLVAALAAGHTSGALQTFTVGYDVGDVNETTPAARAARAVGAEHHELILTADDVATRVPRLFAGLDQPIADQALVAAHAVAEFARRRVTVVVGGEGADELFGGYPRYAWLARAERLRRLVPPAVAARAARLLARPGLGRVARLADVLAPVSVLDRHVRWVTGDRMHAAASLYGPRLALGATKDTLAIVGGDVAGAVMRLDQTRWLPDDVLAKADRASMLVSLEVRTPFLHRELAEFAASVPTSVHLRDGGKSLLRAVLREVVPAADHGRHKVAFRVPAADWLRGPLASMAAEQVRGGALYREGWFDRNAASAMLAEHRRGAVDRSGVLWPLLALGVWLERLRGVVDEASYPRAGRDSRLSPGARGHPAVAGAARAALG